MVTLKQISSPCGKRSKKEKIMMKMLGRANNKDKNNKIQQPPILAEFSDMCRLLLYIIRNKTNKKNTSLKRVSVRSLH